LFLGDSDWFCVRQRTYKFYVYEDLVGKVLSSAEFDLYVELLIEGLNDEVLKENKLLAMQGLDEVELIDLRDEAYNEFHEIVDRLRELLRDLFACLENGFLRLRELG